MGIRHFKGDAPESIAGALQRTHPQPARGHEAQKEHTNLKHELTQEAALKTEVQTVIKRIEAALQMQAPPHPPSKKPHHGGN
jgi:hypothetical protein